MTEVHHDVDCCVEYWIATVLHRSTLKLRANACVCHCYISVAVASVVAANNSRIFCAQIERKGVRARGAQNVVCETDRSASV